MNRNKKYITGLLAATMLTPFFAGCVDNEEADTNPTVEDEEVTEVEDVGTADLTDGTYSSSADGYGGPLDLEIKIEDGELIDIEVTDHAETSPVFTRALPVAKDRIIDAQSPEVDSVSGATFTSFAIKTAVGEAMADAGATFDNITMDTNADTVPDTELEAEETELVIVGGGPAGLSAAIEAEEAGVDVVLLEKLDILSGNGKFDMLIFDLLNSKPQNEDGVEYTIEDFKEAKKGNVMDSDERIDVWAQGAYELDEWFRDMGVELNYYYDETSHMSEDNEYAGEHIHDGLEEKINEIDVDVRTGSKVTDLVVEDDVVTGVTIDTREGTYTLSADAVIVATGGFSHNKELLQKYVPDSEKLMTSNQMGATGDLVPQLEEMGVGLMNMDDLKIFNPMLVQNRELTGARGDGFLLINNEGNRFVPEDETDELKFGLTILDQPDEEVFYIYDQPLYESFYRVQKHNKLGYHTKADSLEELADELGIDSDTFVETVNEYNNAVRGESADEFRDEMPDREFELDGPIYGAQIQSAVHMTKGGVTANEKTEAVTSTGDTIEGLYAAGEVTATSGIYKEAFIFGRIAGEEAAEFIQSK